MYVCLCFGVVESRIKDLLRTTNLENDTSNGELKRALVKIIMETTSAGTNCGICRSTIEQIVERSINEERENAFTRVDKDYSDIVCGKSRVTRPTTSD